MIPGARTPFVLGDSPVHGRGLVPVQNVVGETYLITDLTLVGVASVQGADGGAGCAVDVGAPDLAGCLRRGRLVHGFGQRHVACSLADELVLGQAEPPAPQRQRKSVLVPLLSSPRPYVGTRAQGRVLGASDVVVDPLEPA